MEKDVSVGRKSLFYAAVKFVGKVAFRIFFRKIEVYGTSNIPEGGSLIFVANHQNALMDPLAVIFTNNYQIVYLARADIFNNRLIKGVLNFLKILPVYRLRDGVESMSNNDDTFEVTSAILALGGCIGIMPEGNHGDKKSLRTLKKGVFRIAVQAFEKLGRDIKIVPVGIDYSDHLNFFGKIAVNYGKPLSISNYAIELKDNLPKGINSMRNDLAKELGSLMIDINDEHYFTDKLILDIAVLSRKFNRGQIKNNTNTDSDFRFSLRFLYSFYSKKSFAVTGLLREKAALLNELCSAENIDPLLVRLSTSEKVILFLKLLVLTPFLILGYLFHLPYLLLLHFVLKKIEDPQFISSVKFVIGLIFLPGYYIVLASIICTFISSPLSWLITLIIPVSAIGLKLFRLQFKKLAKVYVSGFNKKRDSLTAEEIVKLRVEIINLVEKLAE